MSGDGAPRRPFRLHLAATFLLPLAVLVGGEWIGRVASVSPDDALEHAQRTLESRFAELLEAARRVTETALPRDNLRDLPLQPGRPWDGRLEGIAIYDARGEADSWQGTPAEPPPRSLEPQAPRFTVRADGVRTRLLVRGAADDGGRWPLGSFIVDSALDDGLGWRELLGTFGGLRVELAFVDGETAADDRAAAFAEATRAGAESSPCVVRLAHEGTTLAVAALHPAATGESRATVRWREGGRAWAALIFALLLAGLVSRPADRSARAVLVRWCGLGMARFALAASHLPAVVLPRSLGSPSLYGSAAPWGLLASPADFVLTALTLAAACAALRPWLGEGSAAPLRWRGPVAIVASGLGLYAAALLVLSLAHDSRLALLEQAGPLFRLDAQLALWGGLAIALTGPASLVATWPGLLRRGRAAVTPPPLRVALALLVLSVAASAWLQHLGRRVALDQLAARYVPEILDQSSRREVALTLALREIRDAYGARRAGPPAGRPDLLAYAAWAGGELFHSGYKSSLDFFTPAGVLVGHFAFDLPPVAETAPLLANPGAGEPRIERERFQPDVSTRQWLLHGELAIVRGEEWLGVVVGHVLDEPENLPFLPWSRPYLAALGAGAPRISGEEFAGGLEYVLYEPDGSVRLTTLLQPPADTAGLRSAARRNDAIRPRAGAERYVGLAVEDGVGRLHLLLLPARDGLERLAAAVRLYLVGLGFLGLVVGAGGLGRFSPGGVLQALRGSFYRKLLAAMLAASALPLIGLALFLGGYVERRGQAELIASATQVVRAAQRVLEDYSAAQVDEADPGYELNDEILHWLRRVVGQEIHVYDDGLLRASSKRELFTSGLLTLRLDGRVQRRLVEEGLPYLVVPGALGPTTIPVAYAPVRGGTDNEGARVIAVPLVLEQRQISRAVGRMVETILLATVALMALLAAAAARVARTVARPVAELHEATSRIAAGEYATRMVASTHDEFAGLVEGFNGMAASLARQREDLERRRDYVETLLRHATMGVVSLDPAGRIVTLNPAAATLLALDGKTTGGGTRLVDALERNPELAPVQHALEAPGDGEPVELDLAHGGATRRLRLARVALRDSAGTGFGELLLLDDVTDLMRSNQLAAWAEMARAIAHEIKNPLTPIQLSTEHLARLLRDRGQLPAVDLEACLSTILGQVRALYEIAGEFSAYAKLPALAPEPVDPAAFMASVVAPYRAAEPVGVRIVEDYRPAPNIAVDRRVLSRALINLVENALQAMGSGGTLRLAVEHDAGTGEVTLSVADSGTGIDPEVRARLFEPYFSTKSSGTGLGLAIVRRAVEAHRGRIDLDSRPGHTVFRIHLPAAASAILRADARRATPS